MARLRIPDSTSAECVQTVHAADDNDSHSAYLAFIQSSVDGISETLSQTPSPGGTVPSLVNHETLSGGYGGAKTLAQDAPQDTHELISVPDETGNDSSPTLGFKGDHWWHELMSLALSILCIASIAIVLFNLDHKPLSSWQMSIRPNALISIFAVISKAALMFPVAQSISQLKWLHYTNTTRPLLDLQRFNDASNGPWGSLLFLFKFKDKALRASTACLITVLALLADPFVQQIITYSTVSVLQPGLVAELSTTRVFDSAKVSTPGGPLVDTNPGRIGAEIDPGLQVAVLSGIFGAPVPPPLSCPTGNCTWAAYTTLGLCAFCVDVAQSSTLSCNLTKNYFKECELMTPSNYTLLASQQNFTDSGPQMTVLNATVGELIVGKSFQELIGFALWKNPFTAQEILECSIQWCARGYDGLSLTSGKVSFGEAKDYNLTFLPHSKREDAPMDYDSFDAPSSNTSDTYRVNFASHVALNPWLGNLFTTSLMVMPGFEQEGSYDISLNMALYNTKDMLGVLENLTTSATN
ncbi:hypothetical protein K461DRAFT_324306 [Myriangium duriaei CBS 260.36]|uniref:Uncharacterized protein n=1 Tax=Myriangium duriaei CBS 260.36 TaxID=1168546 RepID=A0A9P4MD53_9PEZI|nr:hypothetical protein K461DRAFT_324306 [Myriangium duriaei CBS 260.36]